MRIPGFFSRIFLKAVHNKRNVKQMEGFSLNQDRGSMQDALKQYKHGLGTFEQKMPLMGRKFNEFTEQCFAGNSLTERENS